MNDKMTELQEQQELSEIPQTVEHSEAVLSQTNNLAENAKLLNNIYKLAKIYANSTMIPKDYQRNPDNCFVALELSGRMGVSPTLVMQNLVVVQGRPSWAGQACIALVNGSGKFTGDLDFITVGVPGQDDWGVYCRAYRKSDGQELTGTTVTMQMAMDEGWLGKNGSKWKTMPEQMLKYRAASCFARTYCPEVLMGFSTADEAEDVAPEPQKTTVRL